MDGFGENAPWILLAVFRFIGDDAVAPPTGFAACISNTSRGRLSRIVGFVRLNSDCPPLGDSWLTPVIDGLHESALMTLQSKLFRGDSMLEAAAISDPAHIVPGANGP